MMLIQIHFVLFYSTTTASRAYKNIESNSIHNSNLPTSSPSTILTHSGISSSNLSTSNNSNNHTGQHPTSLSSSSSSPSLPVTSSKKNNHQLDKALGHLIDVAGGSGTGGNINDGNNQIANNSNSMNSLREHALHSPLYNLQHSLSHSHSMHSNHANNSSSGQYVQSGKCTLLPGK